MNYVKRSPTVAVIVAAYNAEKTIGRAVRSALTQPETMQVVVVDDASDDATFEAAWRADDGSGRLAVLRQTVNQGPSAARNRALETVGSAEWIAVLDADDYMLEGRVERLLRYTAEADLIADLLIRIRPDEEPHFDGEAGSAKPIGLADFVLGNLGRADGPLDLGFIKPLMRRAFLERYNLRYSNTMRLGEDYDLYVHALAHGARMLLAPACGYFSVVTPGSLSQNHSEIELLHLRDCDLDLLKIENLSLCERRALKVRRNSVDKRLQWRRLIQAWKNRDITGGLGTFHNPTVSVYLMWCLIEQVWQRSLSGARAL